MEFIKRSFYDTCLFEIFFTLKSYRERNGNLLKIKRIKKVRIIFLYSINFFSFFCDLTLLL